MASENYKNRQNSNTIRQKSHIQVCTCLHTAPSGPTRPQEAPRRPPSCSAKARKTLGPFAKKVSGLRLARQDDKCAKITTPVSKSSPQASKTQRFLMVFRRGPRGPQEAPKRPTRGLLAAVLPRGPQEPPRGLRETSKRPPRGLQEASQRPPRGLQEALFNTK